MTVNESPPLWRELLREALPSTVDADTKPPDLRTLFTPGTHREALDPDVTVVRGARGVGKTVWFSALQDERLRSLAADTYRLARLRKVDPITGYGSRLEPARYPGPKVMAGLVNDGGELDDIWAAVLLTALEVPELVNRPWAERVLWLRRNPEARDAAIADADAEAGRTDRIKLVMFDALDRLHQDRGQADRLITGILQFALDLRTRTRNIRAKVFIRHDMYNADRLRFPDASKLTANATDLIWTSANLYGLLFHRMGNAADPAAERLRFLSGPWSDSFGQWQPPANLAGEAWFQQRIFALFAGPYMGSEPRRGRTYTWLPNHLIDGIGQVSPRSFLSAVGTAAKVTRETYPSHRYALHWEGIRRGVQEASKIRVAEIGEDLPWVADALRPLEGLQVPVEQSSVVATWTVQSLLSLLHDFYSSSTSTPDERQVRTGPRSVDQPAELIEELIQLGIMSRRADGRLDLPDVYRIAFHIGRRGGVPKLTR